MQYFKNCERRFDGRLKGQPDKLHTRVVILCIQCAVLQIYTIK